MSGLITSSELYGDRQLFTDLEELLKNNTSYNINLARDNNLQISSYSLPSHSRLKTGIQNNFFTHRSFWISKNWLKMEAYNK